MKSILAAVDMSAISERVVATAGDLASTFGAQLRIVHVAAPDPTFVGYDSGPDTIRDARARQLRDEHRRLEELAAGQRARGIEAKPLLVQGPTVETILETAEKTASDCIVIGTHGRGAVGRLLMGSVCDALLKRTSLPVLVIPAVP